MSDLEDYIQELDDRGFDGYSTAGKVRMLNWARYRIARFCKWYWQDGTATFTLNPGEASYPLASLTNFKSLESLICTTTNYRRKLRPMTRDEFEQDWIHRDLTSSAERGEPTAYYVFNNLIYVLAPPESARGYLANYAAMPTALVVGSSEEETIIPDSWQEAVMLQAEVLAHRRARELDLMAATREELLLLLNDLASDDAMRVTEQDLRVEPYWVDRLDA